MPDNDSLSLTNSGISYRVDVCFIKPGKETFVETKVFYLAI